MQQKYLIGIDEAGRGPLAGPVSVGAVCVVSDFDWDTIPGVNDSKKLSEKKREEIFALAEELEREGKLFFGVSLVGASYIDRRGIVPSIKRAMGASLAHIHEAIDMDPSVCMVKLDGSLRAPKEYINQETIIKGDGKEKVIGLASIIAKVTRDRHMVRIANLHRYAPYYFAGHKGYGTKEHCALIRTYGLSDIHRKSFCRNLIPKEERSIVLHAQR